MILDDEDLVNVLILDTIRDGSFSSNTGSETVFFSLSLPKTGVTTMHFESGEPGTSTRAGFGNLRSNKRSFLGEFETSLNAARCLVGDVRGRLNSSFSSLIWASCISNGISSTRSWNSRMFRLRDILSEIALTIYFSRPSLYTLSLNIKRKTNHAAKDRNFQINRL